MRGEIIGSGETGAVPGRRNRILSNWKRSGLSAAAFAKRAGVSAWTLYRWRKEAVGACTTRYQDRGVRFVRLRHRAATASLVPALALPGPDLEAQGLALMEPAVILHLPSGARIEFMRGGERLLDAAIRPLLDRC